MLANRMLAASSAGGYSIPYSGSFNGTTAFLSLAVGASPTSLTDWMLGYWYKRSSSGSFQGVHSASAGCQNYFDTSDRFVMADQGSYTTTATYGTGTWKHRCIIADTTNGTAGSRLRIYDDGALTSAFDSATDPSASEASVWNTNITHNIGRTEHVASQYFAGLLADFVFVVGSGHTVNELINPSTLAPQNPALLTPNNYGFWLDFSNSGSLGADAYGTNNWTNSNVTQSTDTPTS